MVQAFTSWFSLFMHKIPVALVFALESAGRSMPARMAIIAITTRSSINVNPEAREWRLNAFINQLSVWAIKTLAETTQDRN
jgi:hypothetical protein